MHRDRRSTSSLYRIAAALGSVVIVAACSSPNASRSVARTRAIAPTSTSAPAPAPARRLHNVSLRHTRRSAARAVRDQAGWYPVATSARGIAVDIRVVTSADGATVAVARFFAGHTRFDLHVGSHDPPTNGLAVGPNAAASVSPTERPSLLAGFNGGFLTSSGSGGFEVNERILKPLQAGLATFVIDANGSAHVGVWQEGVPAPGEQVQSARQNLAALVRYGRPTPDSASVWAWGATLGHRPFVARSAVGEDRNGNVLFAGSMSAVPADLAGALLASGASTAMELDINPEWVQLALASRPGGPLFAGVAGQHRPPDQYLYGWTRDFITVLATDTRA